MGRLRRGGAGRGHVVCEVIGEDGGQRAAAGAGCSSLGAGSRPSARADHHHRGRSGASKIQGEERREGLGGVPVSPQL